MSLVINHNMMALNVSRNLGNSYGNLSTSTRRLSSGLRIGTAADDAAGLAIRELMRSDIQTLHQGVRNANDGVSLIQTADGALQTIDDKLIRMKELAEQASTGTYNSDQRMIIDSEYQAMASEITRISQATDFNGIHLLDGNLSGDVSAHNGTGVASKGPVRIHFGTGNDSTEDFYHVSIGNSSSEALGLGSNAAIPVNPDIDGRNITTQDAAGKALKALDLAIISKDTIRANLGAMQNRLEATIDNLTIQSENVQAAESRISDVDVATEMTEFTRQQILTQTATAMLAQANELPKMAQQLLG